MATVRRDVRIARPPDDVWAVLRDPTTICDWFPGVTGVSVEGRTRTITLGSGLPMPETITTIDDDLRRFQYRLTSPIVSDHRATIDVIDDHGDSLVIYSTDIEPAPMAYVFAGATGAALDQLKAVLEAGTTARED